MAGSEIFSVNTEQTIFAKSAPAQLGSAELSEGSWPGLGRLWAAVGPVDQLNFPANNFLPELVLLEPRLGSCFEVKLQKTQ